MTRFLFPAVFAFAAALTMNSVSAQTSLSKDSPFLPAAGSAPATAMANDNLAFTGVSGNGDTAMVLIFDTKLKRSYWITIGSTIEGIKALSFDSARDQVTLTVGGEQKLLTLRSASVANAHATATSFGAPATTAVASTVPTPTQGTPQPPPAPGSIAHQETEARMLVSDLLEIGMQQRKAYEEAQKKAEAEKKKKS